MLTDDIKYLILKHRSADCQQIVEKYSFWIAVNCSYGQLYSHCKQTLGFEDDRWRWLESTKFVDGRPDPYELVGFLNKDHYSNVLLTWPMRVLYND